MEKNGWKGISAFNTQGGRNTYDLSLVYFFVMFNLKKYVHFIKVLFFQKQLREIT